MRVRRPCRRQPYATKEVAQSFVTYMRGHYRYYRLESMPCDICGHWHVEEIYQPGPHVVPMKRAELVARQTCPECSIEPPRIRNSPLAATAIGNGDSHRAHRLRFGQNRDRERAS